MIPLLLQLKNFLSYGSELQTVNFEPYSFICLSGKNGHGKSALLDAMTWAVWGQARKTLTSVKPDQGLLRLGQTHMMVIFDFELGGILYRIKREFFMSYGKAHTQLEFGILDTEKNKIKPLTSKTIKATQEIIENTIKIDFNSFVNSAFLRQGNSNEFSKKSSKDRKEILSSILNLGQYEIIRKRALEKIQTALANKQSLVTSQEKRIIELQKREGLTVQLLEVNEQITHNQQTEQTFESNMLSLENNEKIIAQEQHDKTTLELQKKELLKSKEHNQTILKEMLTLWRSTHKKLLYLPGYDLLRNQQKNLSNTITIFQKQLQEQLELKKKLLENTTQLQQHTQAITLQQLKIVQNMKLEIESKRIELKHALENKNRLLKQQEIYQKELELTKRTQQERVHHINALTISCQNIKQEEELFERRKEYYQQFRAQGSLILNELQNITNKKEYIAKKQNSSCPLCEQSLSESQQLLLQKQYTDNEQFLIHQRTRLAKVVKNLKLILIEQHETIKKNQSIAQQQISLTIEYDNQSKHIQKLETESAIVYQQHMIIAQSILVMHNSIAQLEVSYTQLESSQKENLINDPVCVSISATILDLENNLKKIEYSDEKHAHVQKQLQEIEQKISDYEYIQQDREHQDQRKITIFNVCALLKKIDTELAVYIQKLSKYNNIQEKQKIIYQQKNLLLIERKKLMHEKEGLLEKKGCLTTQLHHLIAIELEHKESQTILHNLESDIFDYQAIAAATGKDGIQALLIEDAIPEIEQEANELLSKLTNNQAQIFIESLRDLKNGSSKETLDINISDLSGIRPYELFSGGEAFKIDFALRIAISKLLARRAGTALQTLIIDEGFGSQDEEGLAHIMDALHAIQGDFSKIIIVSHLGAMKNQFPIHFVVEKHANGSIVNVVEQD